MIGSVCHCWSRTNGPPLGLLSWKLLPPLCAVLLVNIKITISLRSNLRAVNGFGTFGQLPWWVCLASKITVLELSLYFVGQQLAKDRRCVAKDCVPLWSFREFWLSKIARSFVTACRYGANAQGAMRLWTLTLSSHQTTWGWVEFSGTVRGATTTVVSRHKHRLCNIGVCMYVL